MPKRHPEPPVCVKSAPQTVIGYAAADVPGVFLPAIEKSRRAKARRVVCLLAGLLLLASGCVLRSDESESNAHPGKPSVVSSETPKERKTFTVGVALPTQRKEFARRLQNEMEMTARREQLRLEVEDTRSGWNAAARNLSRKGVDALVLCGADPFSATAVQQANAARIPVFTAGSVVVPGQIVAHIAEAEAGEREPRAVGSVTIATVAAYLRGEKVPPVVSIPAADRSAFEASDPAKHRDARSTER